MFPKSAAWLSALEAELLAYPVGRDDDQVESIVQALANEQVEKGGVDYIYLDRPRRRSSNGWC